MFTTFPVSKSLEPYISFFYTITCKKSDYKDRISEFCLPSGLGIMGFHLCGSFSAVLKNEIHELPRFYTVGQQSQHYSFNSNNDRVELYAASFKPTGLWHFFGLDMLSITDKPIETTPLFKDDLQTFTQQFDAVQKPETRIKLIENLLMKKVLKVNPQLNVIDTAIQKINDTYGCCSIAELISYLGISERYLQKMFKKMVGITPSTYKRIVRFNFMFAEMKSDSPTDFQSLSAIFNYYDFSHFSKDFKKYCGACPSKFYIDKFKFLQELVASEALLIERQNSSA